MATELLGGLGLLLVGMSLMTDGLKLAAGSALRELLASWTNTRMRGLLAGFLITAVVQSSSAVTVATIGFANAGMLGLERAIWVIFGSNVGTTMTAWIVALVGLKLDIQALALPLVGIGALLKLLGAQSRRASYGLAVVGFGLLFLGIGVLKGCFEGLGNDVSLPGFESLTPFTLLTYIGIGFVLTALMQSSSAAMVVALSAAESGLLELNAAAALVIGANLGTTSTALLTIIGATPNAKRVAVAHVAFNIVTALVATLLLAPMLWLVGAIQATLELGTAPAITLAIFHTVFNVLGVMLMWPLSPWLVKLLARRFTVAERQRATPRHLDKSTLAVPETATRSMALEVRRLALICTGTLATTLRPGADERWRQAREDIRDLAAAVGDFATHLNRESLTPELSERILALLESVQQYLLVANLNEEIQQLEQVNGPPQKPLPLLQAYLAGIASYLDGWCDQLETGLGSGPDYQAVEREYRETKLSLLRQAGTGQISIGVLDGYLQYMNEVKRACRQLDKANSRLMAVQAALNPDDSVSPASRGGESAPAPEPKSSEGG